MNSLIPLLLALGLTLSGCQSVYYEAMEKMGTHKRDILVDCVEEGKEAQEEARAQFFSAEQRMKRNKVPLEGVISL